jgi:glycosyltransferase involved in cell wall biosynthesis
MPPDGPVVYVDSGSTDGSVDLARSFGVEVVELDMRIPFTAARARNAGFQRALELYPVTEYVQFLDGDCRLSQGWLKNAVDALDARPDAAIVCGRLHEENTEASVYNRLCDMEWNTKVGETDASGGIFMIRSPAFREVGGFNESLIAGEEPELCVRLRRNGWKILRIDADMAWHDADMTRFSQWWRRSVRGGTAFAQGAALHGGKPERHYVREVRSALFWAAVVPAVFIASLAAAFVRPVFVGGAVGGVCGYVLLAARIYRWRRRFDDPPRDALLYTAFCILAKVPQCVGILRYLWRQLFGKRHTLIEYKSGAEKSSSKSADIQQESNVCSGSLGEATAVQQRNQ